MTLWWDKCQGDNWCDLNNVNLDHSHFGGMEGVYITLHGGPDPATISVGQRIIRDRLRAYHHDRAIRACSANRLFVSGAGVMAPDCDEVKAYLAANLKAHVGERFTKHTSVRINLPW